MRFTKCGLQTRAGAIAVTLLLSFALMPGTARAQDKTYLMKISTPTLNDVPDTFARN